MPDERIFPRPRKIWNYAPECIINRFNSNTYIYSHPGEDRWLCTLLLQSGSRVEYSAASDAYTHCPESFAEFYTQRRRWAPSTMANIMDLLVNYKNTVECNDNISMPYIFYQVSAKKFKNHFLCFFFYVSVTHDFIYIIYIRKGGSFKFKIH